MAAAEEEEKEDGVKVVEFVSLSCLILEKLQVFASTLEEVSNENDGTQLQARELTLTPLSAPERATVLSFLKKLEFSSGFIPTPALVVLGRRE